MSTIYMVYSEYNQEYDHPVKIITQDKYIQGKFTPGKVNIGQFIQMFTYLTLFCCNPPIVVIYMILGVSLSSKAWPL